MPVRYAQQAPSGDLKQMAFQVETKAHADKPFYAAAVRLALVGADGSGPRYRLVGPGVTSKWYTDQDQIERLENLRDLMNYAVRANLEQARRQDDTK